MTEKEHPSNTPSTSFLRWEDIVCTNERVIRPNIIVDDYESLDMIPLNSILFTRRMCPFCYRKITCSIYDEDNLLSHIQTHSMTTRGNTEAKLAQIKKVPCPDCFMNFPQNKIKAHIKAKHPKSNCNFYDSYAIKDYTDAVQMYKHEPDEAKERFLDKYRTRRGRKQTGSDDIVEEKISTRVTRSTTVENSTPKRKAPTLGKRGKSKKPKEEINDSSSSEEVRKSRTVEITSSTSKRKVSTLGKQRKLKKPKETDDSSSSEEVRKSRTVEITNSTPKRKAPTLRKRGKVKKIKIETDDSSSEEEVWKESDSSSEVSSESSSSQEENDCEEELEEKYSIQAKKKKLK